MQKKTHFVLKKESEILIYGAGGLGKSRAVQLKNAGYQVVAFLDQNPGSLRESMDIPVYLPQDAPCQIALGKDTIVFICLHNALWHQDVAEMLHDLGYENIIFLPIGNQYSAKLRVTMEKMYEWMADGNYEKLNYFPTFSALTDISISSEDGVIERTSTTVTVWMELTSVFTNGILKQRGNAITRDYGDVSICALKPYIELFKFCKYGQGDIDLYCRAFKEVQNTTDVYSLPDFIGDRIELYERLRLELNRGIDYFINAAPRLTWNAKCHHFNVAEGHHRLIFLLMEGWRNVPVKISVTDYEIWKNDSVYQKCIAYMQAHMITSWFTPLNHTGFYYLSPKREHINPTILMKLQEVLGTNSLKHMSVADCFHMGGYFARALKSMGCENAVCYEPDAIYASVIRLINELFYYNDIEVIEKSMQSALADINVNIAFFSFAGLPENKVHTYLTLIKDQVSHYLILELSPEVDIKAYLSESRFGYAALLKRNVAPESLTDIWLLSVREL